MVWTCMVCSLMLLVIALINVFPVWALKMKWNSQNHLLEKPLLSLFTRKGKKLRYNSKQLKFKALWLIFSKIICQHLINISWRNFSISIEEIYLFSPPHHIFFNFSLVCLFLCFMSWFKLPDFSQSEWGCEQFVCLAQVCHCKVWVTLQIFLFQRWWRL